ncbi:hypothetical protein ACFLVN_04755 [Chloroflexota bacterium]
MTKSKLLQMFSTGTAILLTVLVFASCAGPAEERTVPPSVVVIPNEVAPKGEVEYIGGNFMPGEKVDVILVIDRSKGKAPPLLGGAGPNSHGITVDTTGSFYLGGAKVVAPKTEGVYGVRVYDEKGNIAASSVLMVRKPPEVKK